jgi:hypothetical protein
MKLSIEISLGNEAMEGPRDVAEAILDAFEALGDEPVYEGTIRDRNGNSVGAWKVIDPPEAPEPPEPYLA